MGSYWGSWSSPGDWLFFLSVYGHTHPTSIHAPRDIQILFRIVPQFLMRFDTEHSQRMLLVFISCFIYSLGLFSLIFRISKSSFIRQSVFLRAPRSWRKHTSGTVCYSFNFLEFKLYLYETMAYSVDKMLQYHFLVLQLCILAYYIYVCILCFRLRTGNHSWKTVASNTS